MSIPLVERAKIQARVLVPLVKALQAELGEERANAIVRKALGDMYRKLGEKWWQAHRNSAASCCDALMPSKASFLSMCEKRVWCDQVSQSSFR